MRQIHLSIVSPVYRADSLVEPLVERCRAVAEQITPNYEIILVEDRSPDDSWGMILKSARDHPEVRGLRMCKNFGQQPAIHAGLDAARGEWVVVLDCDLQDPPEEILKLYAKAQEGYEIVHASRQQRQDNWLKRAGSYAFNRLLGYLTDTVQDPTVGNFVIIHRKVVDTLNGLSECERYFPWLLQWVGYRRTKIPIAHCDRADGHSSYSFRKRVRLATDTVLAHSDKPLRVTVLGGVGVTMASIAGAALLVLLYFFGTIVAPGWASLATLVSFFSGVLISVLGMVGLYLGKTFQLVKARPNYIIDETTP